MISYRPFYDTLLANTLHRMKHGAAITTKTLDTLCEVLECSVADILEYKSEES